MNTEFQRIARRDKEGFRSDQCKEIEKTIKWGRLELSSRKLGYQGNISCKDGLDKGQKWYGTISEAEDSKKRWQEYTEELYKTDQDPDNHDGVITHLQPDILE